MATRLSWHKEARARVAPRTAADLEMGRNWWRLKEWSDIRKVLSQGGRSSPDDTLSEPIARVMGMEAAPKVLTPLEMEIIFAYVGSRRVWEYFTKEFGGARVAAILAAPALEAEWDSSISSSVLRRKKGLPEGAYLRALVVGQDAKHREECRVAIENVWSAGDARAHVALAYAFFDYEPWRVQALEEVLSQAPSFQNEQLTLSRDATSMRTILSRRKPDDAVEYVEIVASLGDDALPILLELEKTATKRLHKSHTLALSVLVRDEAAKHLAACISHPATRDTIGDYFTRHKDLAALVLPAASQGASRNAALAKALMIKVCGPAAPTEDTVALDDPALPNVLRDAPWKHPPPALPSFALSTDGYSATVELSDKRKAEGIAWLTAQWRGRPEMNAEEVAAYEAKHAPDSWFWYFAEDDKAIPAETILRFYCAGAWQNTALYLPMLALFGARALPGVLSPKMLPHVDADVLIAIDDPRIATPLAEAMLGSGLPRWSWFVAHPRTAAVGLLAHAHEDAHRRACETMLRRLADAGHSDVIRDVAKGNAHVDAFLERDPRLDVVKPPHVNLVTVTRPRLFDGRPLGDAAIQGIFEMLAMCEIDQPYVGIDDIKKTCDPKSLAEMAWDLAALADGGGRASRARAYPDWMRFALVHLANDEVIRRLTPALKHPMIYRVLETLAERGVRSAAMELATAHERGEAPLSMDRVARRFNQSVDELVETILPTTPLKAEGTTTLEFASRTLIVGFDTTLAPILFMGEQRLASLPRAKKDDDPIAIRLARERWEELKEDVRTIAHLRGRSLEDAMRTARKIAAPHFLAGWANHPLGKHAARGMVWAVERGDRLVTFRVAEDGTFADMNDAELTLAETDFVRVPHLAELSRDVVDPWLRTFSDYGLIQPVPQLGRTPIALDASELGASSVERTLPKPALYSQVSRILRDQDAQTRVLTRCAGTAHVDLKTQWTNRKSLVISATLLFRDAADTKKTIPFSEIDPVELAEALFVLRLVVEAA